MKPTHSPEDLTNLLADTPFSAIAQTAERVSLKGYTYQDLFRIGSPESGFFSVKLRPVGKRYLVDSLRCLESIQDPDNLVLPYRAVFERNDTVVLISDWIIGVQPFQNATHILPEFFRRLARFNQHNPSNGPFTSMYADGHYFRTISRLVDAEIDYHLGFGGLEDYRSTLAEVMQPLKHGLACITFEDMNPGNLFLTEDGRYVLIDTEWLHPGLNLHQFDHMNYLRFREPKWHDITDEAAACYSAYFSELGAGLEEANAQIRAYEALAVVRANTYWRLFQLEGMYEKTRARIKAVLEHDRFIGICEST